MVKPIIKPEIPKACFVNDKIKVSWESENADKVEIIHNDSISEVQLNGSLVFTATENETFSFIVSNREWSLESEEHKILVYAEDHFRLPNFINRKKILERISYHEKGITFVHHKHYLFPAFLIVSSPIILSFFSLMSFIGYPSGKKLCLLLFSIIWAFYSYKYVVGIVHKATTINTKLYWGLTIIGIAYISSIFRINTINSLVIEYRLSLWVGIILMIINIVSTNSLKRIVNEKIS